MEHSIIGNPVCHQLISHNGGKLRQQGHHLELRHVVGYQRQDRVGQSIQFSQSKGLGFLEDLGHNPALPLRPLVIAVSYMADPAVGHGLLPVQMVGAGGGEVSHSSVGEIVAFLLVEGNIHASHQIHDLCRGIKVRGGVIINFDPVVLFNGFHQIGTASGRVGVVQFVRPAVSHQGIAVTHEAGEINRFGFFVDGGQHHDIGVSVPAVVSAVRTDEQEIVDVAAVGEFDILGGFRVLFRLAPGFLRHGIQTVFPQDIFRELVLGVLGDV